MSRRTIFRDLDLLREAGVPLLFDEEQERYRIPGTYYLPPTTFTPEEALSLIVLCHEMGNASGLPFFAPARSAAIKLEGNLPPRLREQLRGMADLVEIQPPPASPLADRQYIFDKLLDAIGRRRAVRIGYRGLTDTEAISTRLCGYRLLFSRRSWYVLGRSSLHRGTRTFNVGRINEITTLEDTYRIPRGFSVDRYLRNAWHLIPEPGPDCEVLVRFQPRVAQNVAEVKWHKTQRTEFLPDGALDFRVTVSGLDEISWWILGYGDQAEILEPPELRAIVAERVRRAAERYRDG